MTQEPSEQVKRSGFELDNGTAGIPANTQEPSEEKGIAPMGVSEWREYGKRYGYWEFFEQDTREATRNEIKSKIGFLRQYLNERPIDSPSLTNEDIGYWLGINTMEEVIKAKEEAERIRIELKKNIDDAFLNLDI